MHVSMYMYVCMCMYVRRETAGILIIKFKKKQRN